MSSKQESKFEKYRGTAGSEVKTANIASDGHELQQIVEGDGTQERIYDSRVTGERFVDFYDDSAAAIREALSNSETGCIRRARQELRECGFTDAEIPDEITEMLTLATEETGYEPLIEITYNQKDDETRLIIEDNGIGISVEEYQVLQRVGYSTSHTEGSQAGQFGIGFMSLFSLTGVNGVFKMKTRSFLTDEDYATAEYVANFEMLDAEPSGYGVRLEFPEFGEAAKEIPISEKVAEYAEGMRVPVLYREFDKSGQETSKSDDFLPRNIEDDYSDDSLVVTFENEYFKAVMSPDSPENRQNGDYITYNVTMPIRRNTSGFSSANKFDAPWKWDFRGKKEDGPIVKCESDPSLEGLVPVENSKYDGVIDEQQEGHIPLSQVPDSAIVMPGPASSRDSYMSGYDEFWAYVSQCLNDSWADIAKERFTTLRSWDDFTSMERDEKEALLRAYSQFGPSYKNNDAQNIQDTLEEAFGVTVPKDICKKIDQSRQRLAVVSRGSDNAHRKSVASGKKVWQIIDEAPDGIYMGKSISQKKAEIAWGLGDTHVIRIEPKDGQSTKERYEELEDLWGFSKLKDLPTSNLAEKLPNLDSDIAEKWENTKETRSTSSNSGNRTSRNPDTKNIDIRVGKRSYKYVSQHSVSRVLRNLSKDNTIPAGRYEAEKLLLYDQTKISGSTAPTGKANKYSGTIIATAAVPKYVYKHMKGSKNVYTDYQTLEDELKQEELDEYDASSVIIFASPDVINYYEDDTDSLIDILDKQHDADLSKDASLFTRNVAKNIDYLEADDFDATVVSVNGGYAARSLSSEEYDLDLVDIIFDKKVPEMDTDAPEFQQVFGYCSSLTAGTEQFEQGIAMVQAMGGKFPSQD